MKEENDIRKMLLNVLARFVNLNVNFNSFGLKFDGYLLFPMLFVVFYAVMYLSNIFQVLPTLLVNIAINIKH